VTGKVEGEVILAGLWAILTTMSCIGLGAIAHARTAHYCMRAQDKEIRGLLQRWSRGKIVHLPEPEGDKFRTFMITRLLTPNESDTFWKSPKTMTNTSFASPDAILKQGGDAYIWAFPSMSFADYLILLNPRTIFSPSTAHAWIFIVDKDGAVLSRQGFNIGHRMSANSASFGATSWLFSNVLVQETKRGFTDRPPLRISIAFDGLRPATVRLETLNGSLQKMTYWAASMTVGPKFDPPTVTAIEHILQSGTDVQQLEALTWLNGHHGRVSDHPSCSAPEDLNSEDRYADAIKSPRVAAAVIALRGSKNAYIREIATQIPLGKGDFDQPWK